MSLIYLLIPIVRRPHFYLCPCQPQETVIVRGIRYAQFRTGSQKKWNSLIYRITDFSFNSLEKKLFFASEIYKNSNV